ncbi:MAG: SdrD B-like domain-containing protein [Methanomicrobiales archaeon]|nr:SdrD B-like domain-containing protein [Methanomicrobiales archaeon]MDI6875369.1 SdrD B-like domain-containing protein [Methanomicrobiales archaeon]
MDADATGSVKGSSGRSLLALIAAGILLTTCLVAPLVAGALDVSGLDASIAIVKYTNGNLSEQGPGPLIPVGSPVNWTYTVTNTGNVTLTGIRVVDDREGEICVVESLSPGASFTCNKSGSAKLGQYKNVGTVMATVSAEQKNYILISLTEIAAGTVTDSCTSYYRGVHSGPAIDVEKQVSVDGGSTFYDADDPWGPVVQPGSPVQWRFLVNNTGEFLLQNVTVVDTDADLNITCPESKLWKFGPGEDMVCFANGTAVKGPHKNVVNASGSHGNIWVYAEDPAHYFGTYSPEPSIADLIVTKSANVSTVYEGDPVEWTILVTNSGSDTATNISVEDDIALLTNYTLLDATPEFTSGTVWSLPSLEPNSSTIFRLVTAFDTVGTRTNAVTVMSDAWDLNTSDNSATAQIQVIERVAGLTAVEIEKATEWGGQFGDGLIVPVGESIRWNYTVTNTGNTVLKDISVTDDRSITVSCPQTCLAPGETMHCTASGTATAGYYENTGTVTAHADGVCGAITDQDASHYYGWMPGTALVQGTAFDDTDGDGILDDGEEGIPGVEVTYRNASGSSVQTTDADGRYVFVNLLPGEAFEVSASLPAGYFRTTPGSTFSTTSAEGQVIDFGYATADSNYAVVFGTVFEDADHDGERDLGESGLSSVVVNLTDSSEVASALTDGYGRYTLRTCANGTYAVHEANPPGYVSTTPDTVSVNLVVGTSGPSPVDFGDFSGAKITGKVFNDTNLNGIDDGEPGLAGAVVSGGGDASTTESDGLFTLYVSASGEMTVTETNPAGYVSTNAIPGAGALKWDNDNLNITIAAPGTEYGGNLFGDAAAAGVALICGTVFDDANGNGVQDPGESGLAGATVTLNGQDPRTTGPGGTFAFAVQDTGIYIVEEENPTGYRSTTPDTIHVNVSALGQSHYIGFGDTCATSFSSVIGIVFDDGNLNGVMDLDETGIPDVVISLSDGRETKTGVYGQYSFAIDRIGSVTVAEEDPAGYISTTPNTVDVHIGALGEKYPVCFGDALQASIVTITGQVVNDTNGNGRKDDGEAGLAGATVALSSGMSQTTGSDGCFQLYGPPGAVITVTETNPQGYRSTNAIPGGSGDKIGNDTVRVAALEAGARSEGTLFLDTLEGGEDLGIDVEKNVLVNQSGSWVRYEGEVDAANSSVQIPVLQSGTPFRWEIRVKNTGTVPVDLTWYDINNDETPRNLSDECPGLPASLDVGGEYTCTIDDTAQALAEYTIGDYISSRSSLQTNQVFVDASYGYWHTFDEDSAAYLGVENPFGVKKLVCGVENGSPGLFDANAPPGPTVYTSIPTPVWVVLVWNFYNEPANLTWTDVQNGIAVNMSDEEMFYGEVPKTIDACNFSLFGFGEPNLGLNYNNVTVAATYDTLPPATASDIAYYTGITEHDESGVVEVLVFEDENGNTAWDEAAEPGIPGVTVRLYDSSGPVTTAYTDAEGRTAFRGLAPGAYTVVETDPAGYASTTANIRHVSVRAGETLEVRFGDRLLPSNSIGGTVFHDLDGSADWNDDEPGIGGVTVSISRTEWSGRQTTTDEYGQFTFDDLGSGSYVVIETDLPGYASTTPNIQTAIIYEGSVAVYFGDRYVGPEPPDTATILATVFDDLNNNTIWDDGEPGIGGVRVNATNGSVTLQCTTNALGQCPFLDLAPDTYTLMETDPEGYVSITPNILTVTVAADDVRQVYFGDLYVEPEPPQAAAIWATVFDDRDANGLWNDNEPGISGIQIHLENASGTVSQQSTGEFGHTAFMGLAPGMYGVIETDPANYVSTTPNTVNVSVEAAEIVQVFFGDREQKVVPPTPEPTPKPRPGPYYGSRAFGSGGHRCDFIENGTLSPSAEGIVPREITICAVDGIGELIVGRGTLALAAGASPLPYAVIKPLQALPSGSGPGYAATGFAYDLAPLDATFQPPATLRMEFTPEEWAVLEGRSLVLRRWDGAAGVWADMPADIDTAGRVVTAEVGELGVVGLFEQVPLPPVAGGPAEPAPSGTPAPGFDWFPYLMAFLLALLALLLAVWWSRRPEREEELPPLPERPLPGGTYAAKPVLVAGMESAYGAIIGVINDIEAQLQDLEAMVQGPARHVFTPQDAAAVADRFFYTAQVAEERMKDPDIRQFLTAEQIEQLNAQLREAVAKMVLLSQTSEPLRLAVDARIGEAGR